MSTRMFYMHRWQALHVLSAFVLSSIIIQIKANSLEDHRKRIEWTARGIDRNATALRQDLMRSVLGPVAVIMWVVC